MIEAVIFDMDGVLIDSEPLWRIAETRAMNAIGVPMVEEDGFLTMGLAHRRGRRVLVCPPSLERAVQNRSRRRNRRQSSSP